MEHLHGPPILPLHEPARSGVDSQSSGVLPNGGSVDADTNHSLVQMIRNVVNPKWDHLFRFFAWGSSDVPDSSMHGLPIAVQGNVDQHQHTRRLFLSTCNSRGLP